MNSILDYAARFLDKNEFAIRSRHIYISKIILKYKSARSAHVSIVSHQIEREKLMSLNRKLGLLSIDV